MINWNAIVIYKKIIFFFFFYVYFYFILWLEIKGKKRWYYSSIPFPGNDIERKQILRKIPESFFLSVDLDDDQCMQIRIRTE